jgi:hypothetical protein
MHSEPTETSSSQCAHCGAPRESQARYCRRCGSAYGTSPEQAPSESAASEVTSRSEGDSGDRAGQAQPAHDQGPMAAPPSAVQPPPRYAVQPQPHNSPPPGYQQPYSPPPPGYEPPYGPPAPLHAGPPTAPILGPERRDGKSAAALAGFVALAVIAVVASITAIYFAVSNGSGSTAGVLPPPTVVSSSSPAPSASAPAPTRSSSAPAPKITPSVPTNAAPAAFLGSGVTGRDSSGYNTGAGCSDNPESSLPGCRDSPSAPSGVDGSCPNGITVDAQSTSCGLALSVRASYRGDGLVTGYSPERSRSYPFSCLTGGPGTTGYTICIGHAGNSELYVRWKR